jgi:hypothetical protein
MKLLLQRFSGQWRRIRHCEQVAYGLGFNIVEVTAEIGTSRTLDMLALESQTNLRRGEVVVFHNRIDAEPFGIHGLAQEELERFGIEVNHSASLLHEMWTIELPAGSGPARLTYVKGSGFHGIERYPHGPEEPVYPLGAGLTLPSKSN